MLLTVGPALLLLAGFFVLVQRAGGRRVCAIGVALCMGLAVAACSGDDAAEKAKIEAAKKAEAERLAKEAAARAAAGPPPGTPGHIFSDCDICPQMVVVPAGDNDIGSPQGAPDADANEYPLAWVRFTEHFAVSRYEIKVREFTTFADATGFKADKACITDGVGGSKAGFRNPAINQGPEHPVVCVNVSDAETYAAWLSTKTGHTYRLMSEGQWEYVRRSKTKTERGVKKDIEPVPDEAGNVKDDNWLATTTPGGSYNSNPFFVFDMLGNADEWTLDCWQVDHRNQPKDGSAAVTTGDCSARAVRGGSWDTRPKGARVTSRRRVAAEARDWRIGFRLMRIVPPVASEEGSTTTNQ
ncbi:MAG: formylglycine-generating enzyme family protein [Hyphomicrobiaceae bacterium]